MYSSLLIVNKNIRINGDLGSSFTILEEDNFNIFVPSFCEHFNCSVSLCPHAPTGLHWHFPSPGLMLEHAVRERYLSSRMERALNWILIKLPCTRSPLQ